MLVLFLLVLPWQISGKLLIIIGDKSGMEDDSKSLAKCSDGTTLVNCEIILGLETLNHDGVKIEDGNSCAAFKGKELENVPKDLQYVQVSFMIVFLIVDLSL